MRRQQRVRTTACLVALGAIALWLTSLSSPAHRASVTTVSAAPSPTVATVVDTYCASCHNGRLRSPSGVLLDTFDAARIGKQPETWARAYRQLHAGAMPPVGSRRPERATYEAVLTSIAHDLGTAVKSRATGHNREVARRLATILWNSSPDAILAEAVQHNRLNTPTAIEQQVRRMLADDRAQAFVSTFFVPWLQLDELAKSDPDKKYFPEYDISLRTSLATETELFLLSQLRDNRDPIELWSASYTFLNEQLASHYGVPNVTGSQFRRTPLPMRERAGLLGQGSILMVTSRHQHGVDAAYTSPAMRARWVRLHFFGAPLPAGFPGAQPVKPELPITPQTRTLPAEPCGNCHRNFFPIGYALENFDPIGRWRTHDQAGPVDTSGTFVDGTPTNGIVQLRQALLLRPEAFRTTITEKLLIFADTGQVSPSSGTPESLVQARRILGGIDTPRWSSIIAAVAQLEPAVTP